MLQIKSLSSRIDGMHEQSPHTDIVRNPYCTLDGIFEQRPAQSFCLVALVYRQSRQNEYRNQVRHIAFDIACRLAGSDSAC